jgi:hypothetical protein
MLYLALYGEGKTCGVLWQLDTAFDEESDAVLQVIKIWRIGEVKIVS